MSGQQVVLSKGASKDISKLAIGKGRADVALNALKEEDLSPEQIALLKRIAEKYEKSSAIEPASVESQHDALIKKFGIEVVGEGKVRLALNGASRIEFLREVQEIASELHGCSVIYADRLAKWANDNTFTAKPKKDLEIAVNGNVKGSTYMTGIEQERKGWNNVDLCDLAVAHAAYFLATGKDLFGGNVVRARGGALSFDVGGLSVGVYDGDDRNYSVAASAALPPRN